MHYTLAILALALTASAARIPRTTCTFGLKATGSQSGQIGQLDDGQNRIGGNLPKGTYSIINGEITDGQGRGCILTPPTKQFQCDQGAAPTSGFLVGENGELSYKGSHEFYACPATDSEYNLYTTPVEGQDKCMKVSLIADACFEKPTTSKAPPPPPPPQTTQQPPRTQNWNQTLTIEKPTTVANPTTIEQPTTVEKPVTVTATQPAKTVTEVQKITITQAKEFPAPTTAPAETKIVTVTQDKQCPAPHVETQTITITKQKECPAPTAPPAETHEQPTPTKPVESSKPAETTPVPQPTKPVGQPSNEEHACPTNLNGEYQYPHLIVPVNRDEPHKAYGTQYNGKITSSISTIFNFDIPGSYNGQCSLVFLFPEQKDLETSSFTFNGDGQIAFSKLKNVATQQTTFESIGEVEKDLGVQHLTPGSKAVVATFACPSGQRISFKASAVGNTDFEYFQDYNPSPIGAYITTC